MFYIPTIAVIFGLIGAAIASKKNKNASYWFLICLIFPIVGVIFVAFSAPELPLEEKIARALARNGASAGGDVAAEPVEYDPNRGVTILAISFLAIMFWRTMIGWAFGV